MLFVEGENLISICVDTSTTFQFIILFIYWSRISPVDRTGSPQGFSACQTLQTSCMFHRRRRRRGRRRSERRTWEELEKKNDDADVDDDDDDDDGDGDDGNSNDDDNGDMDNDDHMT